MSEMQGTASTVELRTAEQLRVEAHDVGHHCAPCPHQGPGRRDGIADVGWLDQWDHSLHHQASPEGSHVQGSSSTHSCPNRSHAYPARPWTERIRPSTWSRTASSCVRSSSCSYDEGPIVRLDAPRIVPDVLHMADLAPARQLMQWTVHNNTRRTPEKMEEIKNYIRTHGLYARNDDTGKTAFHFPANGAAARAIFEGACHIDAIADILYAPVAEPAASASVAPRLVLSSPPAVAAPSVPARAAAAAQPSRGGRIRASDLPDANDVEITQPSVAPAENKGKPELTRADFMQA